MSSAANPSLETSPQLLLQLAAITKKFGPLIANHAIDLDVHKGEIVALLGENGAGKTTLMNILFGHYVADGGTVMVAGADGILAPLEPGAPQAALDAGIGMVHQHFTLAENLSGLDNIVLGTEPIFRLRRDRTGARAKLTKLMAGSGLNVDLDQPVHKLTVGEKQRVEILKALYRDARLLVLDEPTAVLTPQEADSLFATLRQLAATGLSVIIIAHKLAEVLAVSHRIAVLRGGKKVGEMATDQADRRSIAELMVGRDVPVSRRSERAPGKPVIGLRDVTIDRGDARRSLHGVNLMAREGEILGIAGVSGNGQAALARLIAGLDRPDVGSVEIFGEKVTKFDAHQFAQNGIARIPEDRHHDGMVGSMTVAENIAIEDVRSRDYQKFGFLDFEAIRKRAEHAIVDYDVRCPGPDAPARLLSGGNIQKLILARVLEKSPKLILANQPSRGLDVGAQSEVHRRLLEAREGGAAVVLISEDLDELLTLSDQIAVIHAGHVSAAIAAHDIDRSELGLMMAGQKKGDSDFGPDNFESSTKPHEKTDENAPRSGDPA
ncbi:ABC transporter ATP-binding protein [Thalassospira lucentensis]|uniref:ABC transporter ATP-binding protein n=1 Tax=Thalassospira lucentensis TaxID=168935 RepID=UPI002941E110|nr:ABC transporter ATP-binding protein [Thalassospira lucentensis]WOI12973.1 ABC transporter ATP-binding protein [Thalassospira lucentensis]